MKRSHLALAIFAAIAVAACGGSSSNDNAAADKKPATPAKPSTPTAGGDAGTPETTPETPETPEKPATGGAVAGGGGAGGNAGGEKPKEKKPDPAPTGGGGAPVIPSAEQADKDLKAAEAKVKKQKEEVEKLSKEASAIANPKKVVEARVKAAKTRLIVEKGIKPGNTKATEEEIEQAKRDLPALEKAVEDLETKAAADFKKANEKAIAAEKELQKLEELAAEKAVIKAKADNAPLATVEKFQKKAKALKAKNNQTDLADKAGALNMELTDLKGQRDKLKAEVESTLAEYQAALKKTGNEEERATKKKAFDEAEEALKDKQDEINKKDTAHKAAEKLAEDAKKLAETAEAAAKAAEEAAKNVGVVATKGGAQTRIEKIAKKDDNTYLVTFSDKEFTVDLKKAEAAAAPVAGGAAGSTATAPAGENAEAAKPTAVEIGSGKDSYGTFNTKDDVKYALNFADEAGKMGYGYIGDQFYHFGQDVTTADQLKELGKAETTKTASYVGKAFVNTTGENSVPLVATVKADADFGGNEKLNGLKTLSGGFEGFKEYLDKDGKVKLSDNVYEPLKDGVKFNAEIKDGTFAPLGNGTTKVYGNFYGKAAENIGGLVSADTFYGSFGGAKDTTSNTSPAASQSTSGQGDN